MRVIYDAKYFEVKHLQIKKYYLKIILIKNLNLPKKESSKNIGIFFLTNISFFVKVFNCWTDKHVIDISEKNQVKSIILGLLPESPLSSFSSLSVSL